MEALLTRGHRVLVIDDLSTGALSNLAAVADHPQLHVVVDSVFNESCLAGLVDQSDEIYHLAATVGVKLVLEDPLRTVATNIDPTESLLRLVSLQHKPLFLASTSEVYGKNPKVPLSEEDDLVLGSTSKMRWVYACTKALDEFIALAHHAKTGQPVIIARFFNVVGPRQVGRYGMVLPRFVDQALAGVPLSVYDDGEQVRCFGHVLDIVRGMIDLMACPEAIGRVFNLGSDEPVTMRALAERVVRNIDPKLKVEHISYTAAYSSGFEDIRCRVPDLTRVRATIGYRPTRTLDDVIADVIAWKKGDMALR